jgi:hypothetical protein
MILQHPRRSMNKLTTLFRTVAAASVFVLLSVAARAEVVKFHATLKTAWEVPAKEGPGHGKVTATYDTDSMLFTYHVEYSDLSGPAVAAHFHGPATETTTGKPQVMVKVSPLSSPIDGSATLTPEQAKDLTDGNYYFNIHTAANPGGEVRGQVLKNK